MVVLGYEIVVLCIRSWVVCCGVYSVWLCGVYVVLRLMVMCVL